MTDRSQSFESFTNEPAYVQVNEGLVERIFEHLPAGRTHGVLDIAAGTGLMTRLAWSRARTRGGEIRSVLFDLDLPALLQTRDEIPPNAVKGYVCTSADRLPFTQAFDVALFANCVHLLDSRAKVDALAETRRVLHPGGVLGMNSAFYDGAYPAESQPFYGRWIRRAVAESSRTLPRRVKADKAQARQWLSAAGYRDLVVRAGFRVLEMRERRVLLSQAAVCAISSYRDFAMGALRATEEDAREASRALRATVQQTFLDLHMTYLPHNWLEIVAVKV
ncbi:MAG: class I SAM-dependent methyltransferase [Candidatus Dormiibacterota bacterium]